MTDEAGKSTNRFAGIIEFVKGVFTGIGNFFSALFGGIASFGELIGNIASSIVDALGNLGGGMTNAFGDINWNAVIGGIGVGAGVALVRKIMQFLDGINLDKLIQRIGDSLTNVLDSMANALNGFAAKLKAEALETSARAILKMAIAMAILTAALVVLASLDPARLAQAVATMAGLFVAMQKTMSSLITMQLPSGAQLFGLGVALVGIAAAIFLLSVAMQRIQDLDNGDIAAGLTVVGSLITGLTVAAKQMAKDTGTLARAGLSMIGMAMAIYILTFALERMSKMDPAKALAGSAAAVVAIVGMTTALKLIDEKSAKAKGFAFLSVGLAVNLFAMAVEKFGKMKWDVIKQGFVALGLIFGGLALFFKALPPDMALIATEVLIISAALVILAVAIKAMGSMDWEVMKQGLIGVAAALGIMALAAQVMNSAIVGAGAIVIMAVGLTLLAGAVATFGQMGVDTMIKSILGIAAVLLVIAAAGALMGLISPLLLAGGIAFTVLGLGMLLFGAGAWLAATAILALAGASAVGVAQAISAINQILKALPGFAASLAVGIMTGIRTILDEIPKLMGSLSDAMWAVLTMLIDLVLKFIDEKLPDIIQAGYDVLLAFMRGLRDNIGEIATTTAEIIVEYVNGLADAINENAEALGEAGRKLAWALITGLVNALIPKEIREKIGELVTGMVDKFKEMLGINSPSTVFLGFGGDILAGLLNGLVAGVTAVITFFTELPGKIIEALGDLLSFLLQKGRDLLQGMWDGIKEKFEAVKSWVTGIPSRVTTGLSAIGTFLKQKGRNFLQGMWDGIREKAEAVKSWVSGIPTRVSTGLSAIGTFLTQKGRNFIQGFWDGVREKIEAVKTWLESKVQGLIDIFNKIPKMKSPSRVMMKVGENFIEGLRIGMAQQFKALDSDTVANAESMIKTIQNAVKDLGLLDGMNPSITPVLDLSMVEAKARTLGDLLGIDALTTDLSYINAQQIATTSETSSPTEELGSGDTYLNFVQNNNSPKALSTGDIYRGQKSQIALARKELGLVNR